MSIYQRYLANQTPTPLNLVPPEDTADWAWTTTATLFAAVACVSCRLDQRSAIAVPESDTQQQRSGNPFDQSSQPQQQPQQQPAQQEQKTATV
ncbi:hypothetical protein ACLK19_01130 [Escherichia coli]